MHKGMGMGMGMGMNHHLLPGLSDPCYIFIDASSSTADDSCGTGVYLDLVQALAITGFTVMTASDAVLSTTKDSNSTCEASNCMKTRASQIAPTLRLIRLGSASITKTNMAISSKYVGRADEEEP